MCTPLQICAATRISVGTNFAFLIWECFEKFRRIILRGHVWGILVTVQNFVQRRRQRFWAERLHVFFWFKTRRIFYYDVSISISIDAFLTVIVFEPFMGPRERNRVSTIFKLLKKPICCIWRQNQHGKCTKLKI